MPSLTLSPTTTSQGITIGGISVFLTVFTRNKGRPGREGLVWKVYNQETCSSCILHLSATRFLEQVGRISPLH